MDEKKEKDGGNQRELKQGIFTQGAKLARCCTACLIFFAEA